MQDVSSGLVLLVLALMISSLTFSLYLSSSLGVGGIFSVLVLVGFWGLVSSLPPPYF